MLIIVGVQEQTWRRWRYSEPNDSTQTTDGAAQVLPYHREQQQFNGTTLACLSMLTLALMTRRCRDTLPGRPVGVMTKHSDARSRIRLHLR